MCVRGGGVQPQDPKETVCWTNDVNNNITSQEKVTVEKGFSI